MLLSSDELAKTMVSVWVTNMRNIHVLGVKGVGKSTLCEALAKHYNLPYYEELWQMNQAFKPLYRGTPYDIQKTFCLLTAVQEMNAYHTGGIVDQSAEGCLWTYGANYLGAQQLSALSKLVEQMMLPEPYLRLVLVADTNIIAERIKTRARHHEIGAHSSPEHLSKLQYSLYNWAISRRDTVLIDASQDANEVFRKAVAIIDTHK